jgi:hypothetical protein
VFVLNLPENAVPNDPSQPRVKGVLDFAKQGQRFDNREEFMKENDLIEDQLIIDHEGL